MIMVMNQVTTNEYYFIGMKVKEKGRKVVRERGEEK